MSGKGGIALRLAIKRVKVEEIGVGGSNERKES